jgi:hypothetical protein
MSVHYATFSRGASAPAESNFTESVAVATQTFRRSPFARKAGKLVARVFGALGRLVHGSSGTASDAYAARRARDVDALNRMARSLQTSQPALAAELMLLACR